MEIKSKSEPICTSGAHGDGQKPTAVLVAGEPGRVCPAKARVLYHGAEHTHMAQDSEHVKEDPGRAEDCSRAAQACEGDRVAAASLPLPKPPTGVSMMYLRSAETPRKNSSEKYSSV